MRGPLREGEAVASHAHRGGDVGADLAGAVVVLDDTSSLIGSGALFSYDEAARLSYKALQSGTIVVAILPVLILYPLILKYYTRGVMEGGVKE